MRFLDRSKMATGILAVFLLVLSAACGTTPSGGSLSGITLEQGPTTMGAVSSRDVLQFENYSAGPNSHILVIDPEGRKIGYDQDQDVEVNELETGWYSGRAEVQQISILHPIAGSYTFKIAGMEPEIFTAGISYGLEQVVDSRDFEGRIQEGKPFFAIIDLNPESKEPLQFSVFQYY